MESGSSYWMQVDLHIASDTWLQEFYYSFDIFSVIDTPTTLCKLQMCTYLFVW